jgi:hypothetical protein
MTGWEYHLERIGQKVSEADLRKRLEELGALGWELISIQDSTDSVKTVHFKRPTPAKKHES